MAGDIQPNFFTKAFNSFVTKLPYSSGGQGVTTAKELNPKFDTFHKVGSSQKDRVYRQAVSTSDQPGLPSLEGVVVNKAYHDYLYALIDTDKPKRLSDYRIMASYAEISHALDEICDEMLVKDDKGKYCTLTLAEGKDSVIVKELQKNFNQLIEHFNIDNKGFEYFRSILIDAELYFENVIN